MLKLMIGLILLLIPFLLIERFKDKRNGFYSILFLIIAGQFLIGFITQLFGIFNYFNLIIVNLVIAGIVIFKTDFKKVINDVKKIKIDWMLVFLIIIVFICLNSVHFNYTGTISKLDNYHTQVENFNYPYPYFSDEWVGISLIDYSIRAGKLPLVNSLWYDYKFSNLGFGIHTLSAEFCLLLGVRPLNAYIWITFFNSLLICLLVYFILRENKVSKFSSFVASVGLLYITNSGNPPGLWTFIPVMGGITFLMFAVLFSSIKENKLFVLSGIFSFLFYPVLIVFVLPLMFFYYFFDEENKKNKTFLLKFLTAGFFIFLILLICIRYIGFNSYPQFFKFILLKFFSYATYGSSSQNFWIWNMIPLPILIFSGIGIINKFKSKFYLMPLFIIGLSYWIVYPFVEWRFIIGYERLIITLSILIVMMSGFGFDFCINLFNKLNFRNISSIVNLVKVLVVIFLLILSFFYVQINPWEKLSRTGDNDQGVIKAVPLQNAFLHEDDLKLFENITQKRFISDPWKGLIIGSIINNYPLHSKGSIITNQYYFYDQFIRLSCTQMQTVSIENKIDYVYTKKNLNCSGFNEIGKSAEGYILYKVNMANKIQEYL